VIGGVVGALVTAAVLAAIWQPFSGTDAESPAGTATQTPQPGITIEVPDEDLSFAEAVAVKAMPSVVSVAIEQSVYDPFTGRRSTQVVGNGSGVIIRQDGYIITNDHVVEGADAISLVNTVLGMAIDTRTFRPVLARGFGGLSGPAIRPVAVRMVWQVARAVDVPVIGMGGITDARDAAEFMLAGATAVAVGTANFVDPTSTVGVVVGLERYCEAHGLDRVAT